MEKPKFSMSLPNKARSQSSKAGYPPGTVFYVGKDREGEPEISSFSFLKGGEDLFYLDNIPVNALNTGTNSSDIAWINIVGVHQPELIKRVGEIFSIHSLTQEDIANTVQRPKAEDFSHYLFCIVKMISFHTDTSQIHIEQLSLILTQNRVLTFQEERADVFDPMRERLKVADSRLRRYGADYLFFALLDVIVSNYFFVTEQLSERLTDLEQDIIAEMDEAALTDMQQLRKSLQDLFRAIYPLREVVNYCMRSDSPLVEDENMVYFRELGDQLNQVMDTLSSQQESVNNLQSLYLALASQKTNDVMKVLTVISTIFLPLSFLAGIYGMNFDNIPELHWPYSYYLFWAFNLVLIGSMLFYFRYKSWI